MIVAMSCLMTRVSFSKYFPYLTSEVSGLVPNDFYDLGDVPMLPNNVSFFSIQTKNIIKNHFETHTNNQR